MTDAAPPSPGSSRSERRDLVAAWGLGLLAAVAVVGTGLRSGAWMNVDLVVTDVTPVPRGVWGLGPELPRRVPFALPFAWLSAILPGELPWKVATVLALASCVAGTWRLVGRWDPTSSPLARAGAGLLVGVGPFAVTRVGVGHLGLTFALAVLPWALDTLLRPAADLPRTALWSLALGLTGPFGGTFALLVTGVGLFAGAPWRPGRRRRGARTVVVAVVAQLPWLAPTAVVALAGAQVRATGDFATDASGPGGLLRVLAGHGFWAAGDQVGGTGGWEVPLAGIALVGLAVVGARHLPTEVRTPALVVGAVGLVGTLASALPGLDAVLRWAVEQPGLGLVREGQRLLALFLVVAVPAAAVGAGAVGRRLGGVAVDVVPAVVLVVAVLLVPPGLGGAAGALEPLTIPSAWAQVRDQVEARPGTVLALPWSSYPRLELTDGRRVVHPMRVYLGGDVLTSSDPGIDDGRRERSDPREPRAEALARRLVAGEDVAADLAALGVRWVVVVPTVGRPPRLVGPASGLRPRVDAAAVQLWEVPGWSAARTPAGAPRSVDPVVAPLLRADPDPLVVAAPGSGGWWRSGGRGSTTGRGLLSVPDGGVLAYPGALVALAGDGAALALGVRAAAALRRRRRNAHVGG